MRENRTSGLTSRGSKLAPLTLLISFALLSGSFLNIGISFRFLNAEFVLDYEHLGRC